MLILPDITLMALNDHLQKISEEKERYDESYNDYDLVCRFRSLTQLWKKLIKKSEVPDIRFHVLCSETYSCNNYVKTKYTSEDCK